MPAERVHSAAGTPNVSHEQLEHCGRADDLRAKAVLRPTHGVNDGADFLHVAILADGRVHVGGFEELILGNSSDPFHHLGGVARILLLQ